MLTCYPIRAFRSCLSRCHLNFVAMHIFVDKVHSCYRNGLDGGRDMRSLSGLYFFLQFIVGLSLLLSHLANRYSNVYIDKWFFLGTFFSIISLLMVFIRPYNKAYMNYLDALLLLNIAFLSFSLHIRLPMLFIARCYFQYPLLSFVS